MEKENNPNEKGKLKEEIRDEKREKTRETNVICKMWQKNE